MNKYSNGLHLLRAIAALSIVAIHVTSGQIYINDAVFVWNQLARFASGVFIILSGIVLFFLEQQHPSPSYGHFLKQRYSKLLIPYVFWTFVYTGYTLRNEIINEKFAFIPEFMLAFINNSFTGSGYNHLYFIFIIVQLYALFPFFLKWQQKNERSLFVTSLIISLFSLTMIYFQYLGFVKLPVLPVSYVSLCFGWLFYFVLGMSIAKHLDFIIDLLREHKICLFLLSLSSFLILLIDGTITNTETISVKPATFFYTLMMFFFLFTIILSAKNEPKQKSFIIWIARHSFLIYFVHPLFLNILVMLGSKYNFTSLWMGVDGLIYLYISTLTCTLSAIYIISKLPFNQYLGAPRKKGRPRKLLT